MRDAGAAPLHADSVRPTAADATHDDVDDLAVDPTPIGISRRVRALLVVAAVVAVAVVFWAAPTVPTLLIGGATLALVLSFPVSLLARVMPRGVAILIVVVGLVLATLVALAVLIPLLVTELTELVTASPQLATDAEGLVRDWLQRLRDRGLLPMEPDEVIGRWRQGVLDRAQALARGLLTDLLTALTGALEFFITAFGILFIAIYLLVDIRRFKAAYLRVVSHRYRADALALWDALDRSLSRYLGGLLVSMAAQGVLAAAAMWALGVPYAILLGLWTSATAILPYVGAFLGAIPAVLAALTISPLTALWTALAYLVINQIEGNLLTPRIQGQAVRVHPMLIFLAIIAGGEIGGLAGAALAVPTLAVLRVVADFFAARLRVES